MEEKDSGSLCLPDTAKPTDLFDLLWRRMKEVGLGRFPAGRDVSIEIQYDAGVCCFTTRISVGEEGKEQVIHLCHVYRGRLRVIIDKISYRRNTEGQQIQIVSHWLNRAKSIRDEERAGRLEMTAAMLGFPRPF
jgi:hypothetical protein